MRMTTDPSDTASLWRANTLSRCNPGRVHQYEGGMMDDEIRVRVDITGQEFGRLTVLSLHGYAKGKSLWNCICSCGNSCVKRADDMKSGRTQSCGCLLKERTITHGMTHSKTYQIWKGIKNRCQSTRDSERKYYKDKGITVCDEWDASFESFLRDMGECPEGYSIDRIDSSRGYEPENCRWASNHVQHRNTGQNVWVEFNGRRMVLADWADEIGISRMQLGRRLKKFPVDVCLTTPPGMLRSKSIRATIPDDTQ